MFLPLDMIILRISLSFDLITTHHNQTYSELTLIIVSSMIYSEILFLFDDIFLGLYFYIHIQIETWLLLTIFKKDNALATFLADNQRKYKYNP